MSHVPFVDEEECIGCNLCMLVCPVPDCITMEEVSQTKVKESWADRVAKSRTQPNQELGNWRRIILDCNFTTIKRNG